MKEYYTLYGAKGAKIFSTVKRACPTTPPPGHRRSFAGHWNKEGVGRALQGGSVIWTWVRFRTRVTFYGGVYCEAPLGMQHAGAGDGAAESRHR